MNCRDPKTSKRYLTRSTQDVAFIMQQANDEDIEFALEADFQVWPLFAKLLEENNIHLDPIVEDIILMKCSAFVNALCKLKKVYRVERPYEQARKLGVNIPNTYTKTVSGEDIVIPLDMQGNQGSMLMQSCKLQDIRFRTKFALSYSISQRGLRFQGFS